MSWYHPATLFDKVFESGLLIKGVLAAGEFLSGLLLLFVSPAALHRFLAFITQQRLSENPHDKLAHFVLHSADSLNVSNKGFVVAYLWLLAAIKLTAVIGILRGILWVYPFALVSLGLIMLLQVYTIAVDPSFGLIVLTIFDICILGMICREYGKAKSSALKPRPSTDDR